MEDLKKEVAKIVRRHSKDYDNGKRGFLSDLSNHGCVSGMVCEFIYYKDTTAFTNKHRDAIMELLADDLDNGMIDSEAIAKAMQGGTFDNWLCWYAFERIALENFND